MDRIVDYWARFAVILVQGFPKEVQDNVNVSKAVIFEHMPENFKSMLRSGS